ncbi:MAG: hypothetical protein NVSMB38_24690 [Ktedonobacteraceae bacterium]
MLAQLKTAYANHLWVRLVACVGLFVSAYLLMWISGGFPPWAWRFLFQTLPQVPVLAQARGVMVFVPLFGLVLLSLALLVVWSVFATAWLTMLVYWHQERRARQRFAAELREAEQIAGQATNAASDPSAQVVGNAWLATQEVVRQKQAVVPLVDMSGGHVAVALPVRQAVGANRGGVFSTNASFASAPMAQARPVSPAHTQLHVVPQGYEEITERDTIPERDYQEDEDEDLAAIPIAIDHIQEAASLRFIIGVASDAGIVRKDMPNEDTLLAIQGTCITQTGPQPVGLFVVADGMGGHANGREASRLAIQAFSDVVVPVLLHSVEDEEIFVDLMKDGVHRANLSIYQRNRGQKHMMGTTITAVLLVGAKAYIANVGDSRTYIYRKGKNALAQVTRDHSHVALLVEKGSIARDDIYTHPHRNQIYRCLGEHASVQIDLFQETLTVGDAFLLCSDGLWEMVRDPMVEKIMRSSASQPSHASATLLEAALQAGGADNVSVVVVSVTQEGIG